MTKEEAQKFESAYNYAREFVYPVKMASRQTKGEKAKWWQFKGTCSKMRKSLAPLSRYLAVAVNTPHVMFAFIDGSVIPDKKLIVFPFDDYFHFGLMQSKFHTCWAWEYGGSLEERLAYTHKAIMETFPFPMLPDGNYNPRIVPDTDEAKRVSEVAEELYTKRQAACKALNLGLTKVYNYIKGKTPLTGLSTEHQALITELQGLHEQLNNAVCACYGWPEDTWRDENEVLKRLLELNLALTG